LFIYKCLEYLVDSLQKWQTTRQQNIHTSTKYEFKGCFKNAQHFLQLIMIKLLGNGEGRGSLRKTWCWSNLHPIHRQTDQLAVPLKLCLQKWELKSHRFVTKCICNSHNHLIKRAMIFYHLSWILKADMLYTLQNRHIVTLKPATMMMMIVELCWSVKKWENN